MLEIDNFDVRLGKWTTDGVFFVKIMGALSLYRYLDCIMILKTGQGIDACLLVSQGGVPLAGHSVGRN